jgi:hypothetical protein
MRNGPISLDPPQMWLELCPYTTYIRLGLFLLLKTNLLEENSVNTLFSFNALQNVINKCNLLTRKVVVKLTILFYLSLLFVILQNK